MKKTVLAVLFLSAAFLAFTDEIQRKKLFITAGGGITEFDGKAAGTLSASAGTNLLPWLEGGINLTAFHTLERSYKGTEGRDFQAESGFAAIYLRPHFVIGGKLDIGFPVQSGSGTLLYRYEEKYRDELVWTEEILDQINYGVTSLGVDIRIALCDKHSLTLSGGYRGTSPIGSPYADKDALNGFGAEIRYGWKLF